MVCESTAERNKNDEACRTVREHAKFKANSFFVEFTAGWLFVGQTTQLLLLLFFLSSLATMFISGFPFIRHSSSSLVARFAQTIKCTVYP